MRCLVSSQRRSPLFHALTIYCTGWLGIYQSGYLQRDVSVGNVLKLVVPIKMKPFSIQKLLDFRDALKGTKICTRKEVEDKVKMLRELQQSTSKAGDQGLNRSLFGQSTLGQSAFGQSYLAQKSAKKVGFGASTFAIESKERGRSQTLNSHMDLMNSLWEQQKPTKKAPAVSKGFEV